MAKSANGTGRPRGRPRTVRSDDDAPAAGRSNGPTPEQISEALASYTRLSTAGQRINQEKGTLLSAFEKLGGDKATLKELHRLMMLDPVEAQLKLERLLRYSGGQGIVVRFGTDGQGSVLHELGDDKKPAERNTQGDRDLAAARAHGDGYNSGLRGSQPSDNPFRHMPGSEQYVQWHNGRDEGQADRIARNPALADRISKASTADATMPEAPEVAPPI